MVERLPPGRSAMSASGPRPAPMEFVYHDRMGVAGPVVELDVFLQMRMVFRKVGVAMQQVEGIACRPDHQRQERARTAERRQNEEGG